jgi:predicted lipid-binding transport protein (Tim44 family)
MSETTAFDFWILLIFAAAYAHILQLSIQRPPTQENAPELETDASRSGPHRIDNIEPALALVDSSTHTQEQDGSGWRFDAAAFLSGAWIAYETIVKAYAEGDSALLRTLLGDEAYGVFDAVISERRDKNEQVELAFVCIQPPEIIETDISGDLAQVTVRFDSELVTTTRAENGRVVSGDPHKVVGVSDLWTFARHKSSTDPTWKLIATSAE